MKNKKIRYTRLVIQLVALLLTAFVLFLIFRGYKTAIHAICPYATVCFGLSKVGLFSFGKGLFWLTVAVGWGILVSTMFLGRKFCGYVCPLGTIQEAIFSLRKLKYRKKHRLSYFYEKRLSLVKYYILVITTILALLGFGFAFIRLCPIFALSSLPRLFIPGLTVMVLIIGAGFFIERFGCRYLCPFAALMNVFQGIGKLFGIKRVKINRNLERCIDCGLCEVYCPMNLNITAEEYVQALDCIHCNICICRCPKPGTLCTKKED
jgi:polyferredoxin